MAIFKNTQYFNSGGQWGSGGAFVLYARRRWGSNNGVDTITRPLTDVSGVGPTAATVQATDNEPVCEPVARAESRREREDSSGDFVWGDEPAPKRKRKKKARV